MIEALRPALNDIDNRLTELSQLQQKPAGTVRITSSQYAAQSVLWPALSRLLPSHPHINVEVSVDAALTDIISERFDAGIRLGESIARDMIAMRIGPDLRMAVVAAPAYFTMHPKPQTPQELTLHRCINLRFPSTGGLYIWEFSRDGRDLNVRVDGQLIFNDMAMALQATLEGFGLACVMEDQVQSYLRAGTLIRVLEDWCPVFPGYHLYYPARRPASSAFSLLLQELRYTATREPAPK